MVIALWLAALDVAQSCGRTAVLICPLLSVARTAYPPDDARRLVVADGRGRSLGSVAGLCCDEIRGNAHTLRHTSSRCLAPDSGSPRMAHQSRGIHGHFHAIYHVRLHARPLRSKVTVIGERKWSPIRSHRGWEQRQFQRRWRAHWRRVAFTTNGAYAAGVHNRCLGLLVALLAIAFVILTIPPYLRRRWPAFLPIPANY